MDLTRPVHVLRLKILSVAVLAELLLELLRVPISSLTKQIDSLAKLIHLCPEVKILVTQTLGVLQGFLHLSLGLPFSFLETAELCFVKV